MGWMSGDAALMSKVIACAAASQPADFAGGDELDVDDRCSA